MYKLLCTLHFVGFGIIAAMMYEIISNAQPSDEEAAAIAAVVASLVSGTPATSLESSDGRIWNNAAKLVQQGLQPRRTGISTRWNTISRLRRRAAGGFYGIIGM